MSMRAEAKATVSGALSPARAASLSGRGEVVLREEGVHERVDAREVVLRALLGEGLRFALRERLELMVGREHLGELVRFEEARRGFAAQRVERLGEMRHGDTSRVKVVVSGGIIA